MIKGKYIITFLSPILFNQNIMHNAININSKVKSAGFFRIIKNNKDDFGFDVICYGESESLNIKSQPLKDAMLIKKFLLSTNYAGFLTE